MTNPVGDFVNNPMISNPEEEDPSLLARFLNSGFKGAAWLPDALANNVPKAANYLGDALINRFVGEENKDPLEWAY